MKSLFTFFVFVLVISLMSGAWFWLDKNRPEVHAELREIPAVRVEITKVTTEDVIPLTKITGRLVPVRRTQLHFEVSGQVQERLVEPGQKVRAGDDLVRIESGDFEDVLSEMEIQFEQERLAIERDQQLLNLVNRQITLLQREINRQEKLKKQSMVSQSKIDETRRQLLGERSQQAQLQHSVKTAESRLKMRQVEINKAQRNLQRTVLKSPINATVNSVDVSVGDYVSTGQAVIELVQVDELELVVDATGKEATALELGQVLNVVIDGKKYQGKLTSLQSDPDPVTNTHALKIRLNGKGLFPGQLGEVQLTGKTMTGALVVPVTAVLRENGESYLFRLDQKEKDHYTRRIPVIIKSRDKDRFIVSGIEAGDLIVSRDVAALEDGQKVVVN